MCLKVRLQNPYNLTNYAGFPVVGIRYFPLDDPENRVFKRSFDIIFSLLFLILIFSWLAPILAILIKLDSRGPIFFKQDRWGLNNKKISCYKFRTMFKGSPIHAGEGDFSQTMENDTRVTRLGRFLRKTSLDELPQLWNVFRGEMSLVGPRPLPVDEVARFDDMAHRRRLSVKPGLTCLWQVSGRNNVTDFKEWVRLDLHYIDNWSIWLDLKILLRTIPAVFSGAGAK